MLHSWQLTAADDFASGARSRHGFRGHGGKAAEGTKQARKRTRRRRRTRRTRRHRIIRPVEQFEQFEQFHLRSPHEESHEHSVLDCCMLFAQTRLCWKTFKCLSTLHVNICEHWISTKYYKCHYARSIFSSLAQPCCTNLCSEADSTLFRAFERENNLNAVHD